MKQMKSSLAMLFLLIFCLIFVGCHEEASTKNTATERDITLRVATIPEQSETVFLNNQINKWIWEFEAEHKNVDVVLEDFAAIERLQTEMMAGKGPDILLLPASYEWSISQFTISFPELIRDANQAMRNGLFYDISQFYDADSELGKDALQPTIMEAGVVDGKRFVLPLRYNLMTAYVDLDALEEDGFTVDIFEKDIVSFWETVTQSGEPSVMSSVFPFHGTANSRMNLLGELLDYENQEVLLTQEMLVDYLRSYMELEIAWGSKGGRSFQSKMSHYISEEERSTSTWINDADGHCMFICDLDYAIHDMVIAKAEEVNLDMYPLRATDGSVIADITFYGAVGASSEHPELAYEFLRYFLSEDAQWEQSVDTLSYLGDMIGEGWPVRTKGSVAALCERFKNLTWKIALLNTEGSITASNYPVYTDEDMPILSNQIDKARFPTGLEEAFSDLMNSLYTPAKWERAAGRELSPEELAEIARAMDLEAMAAEFIEDLEWHLGEG